MKYNIGHNEHIFNPSVSCCELQLVCVLQEVAPDQYSSRACTCNSAFGATLTLQVLDTRPVCVLLYIIDVNSNWNADLLEEEELVWV